MYKGKPLICLTSDMKPAADGSPRTLDTPKTYGQCFANAGGIPIVAGELCPCELAGCFDALVLTGGYDIEPRRFNEDKAFDTVKTDPERDEFELEAVARFVDAGKPVFGICRGIQVINVFFGGDLYQDLPGQLGFDHYNSRMRHPVFAAEGSALRALFGETFRTNSTHHQAVRRLGDGLQVTARSVEGITEALSHETLPVFATQFHPERLTGAGCDGRTPDFTPLFEFYVGVAKAVAEGRDWR